jgi:hypothetical protein
MISIYEGWSIPFTVLLASTFGRKIMWLCARLTSRWPRTVDRKVLSADVKSVTQLYFDVPGAESFRIWPTSCNSVSWDPPRIWTSGNCVAACRQQPSACCTSATVPCGPHYPTHAALWKVLEHPLYSIHMSPYGFYVFGRIKKWLKGRSFGSGDDIEVAFL